jgi:hypothetical protein
MEPAMDPLRITEPCHEPWDAMTPDVRGRHCAVCAKTVIDVTAMTPAEGRAFIASELPSRLARGERVCVRSEADARGRLLRPGVRRYLLTNGLAALLAMSMAGCGDESPRALDETTPTKGTQPMAGAVPMPRCPVEAAPHAAPPPTLEPLRGEPAPIPPADCQPTMGRIMLPPEPEARA